MSTIVRFTQMSIHAMATVNMQWVLSLWLIIFRFINKTLAGSHLMSGKKELVTRIEKILDLL